MPFHSQTKRGKGHNIPTIINIIFKKKNQSMMVSQQEYQNAPTSFISNLFPFRFFFFRFLRLRTIHCEPTFTMTYNVFGETLRKNRKFSRCRRKFTKFLLPRKCTVYRVSETRCLSSIHRFFSQKHTYILAYLKRANFSEQIL
jgi:hypothetical protein